MRNPLPWQRLSWAGVLATAVVCLPAVAGAQFEVSEQRDLVYHGGADANDKQRLDLFLPKIEGPRPVLLWIHGGAWAFGDRDGEAGLARGLAREGIAVAAMSYRLSPALWATPPKEEGVSHPAHMEDVARALAFLHRNAQEYGLDRRRLFVGGYSAGAQLSALLALDPRYLEDVGLSLDDLRAVVPIAGAYDLVAYYSSHVEGNGKEFADAHIKDVFGHSDGALRLASPSSYLQNSHVPMLIISESQTFDYTRVFERQVEAAGDELIRFWHIADETHKSLSDDLGSVESRYRGRIVEFLGALSQGPEQRNQEDQ